MDLKKPHLKKSVKRVMFFGILSVVSIILVVSAIAKTFFQIINKYNEADTLESTLAELKENEEVLENDVTKLQDPEYLARYAREKYFYSKNGELIIRIPTE